MEMLAPGIAIWTLRDTDDRNIVNAQFLHRAINRRYLSLAAVDQQQIGPFARFAIGIFLLEPGEAALEHFAHHREIVARCGFGPLDVELTILAVAEALGPGDDHPADHVGTHDVAIVVNLD